jgi:hypothetical protein
MADDILEGGHDSVLVIGPLQDHDDDEDGYGLEVDLEDERRGHPIHLSFTWLEPDGALEGDVDDQVLDFWLSKSAAKDLINILNRKVLALEGLPRRTPKN